MGNIASPRFSAAPLVVRFGALGDMVLLTPLLRDLHRRYGQPCRVLGSGSWLAPLYASHPDVGATLALASRKRPYLLDATQRALVTRLRAEPIGPVYVCDDYARAKIRWLLDKAGIAGEQCVFANPDCMLREGEHWIERWRRFAAMTPVAFKATPALGTRGAPATPCLTVTPADRADLHTWLAARGLAGAPLVLLQPGNKRTLKRGRVTQMDDDKHWPLERWVRVIDAVLARCPDARIVLCGAPPEAALLRELADLSKCPRVFAAGDELPLRRLLALCEHASAMLSIDTGPAHAAAALGCPLIVLYGAQPPSLWLPRSPTGSAVLALGGLPQRDRVDRIGVDEVVAAWQALPLRAPVAPSPGATPALAA